MLSGEAAAVQRDREPSSLVICNASPTNAPIAAGVACAKDSKTLRCDRAYGVHRLCLCSAATPLLSPSPARGKCWQLGSAARRREWKVLQVNAG